MVKEAYVSEETAKLLKEKGFNEKCIAYYQEGVTKLAAPTHQMAMAWLREKGIIIIIDYNEDEECEENERYGFSVYKDNKRLVDLATYVSYEEAVEAALKYCSERIL